MGVYNIHSGGVCSMIDKRINATHSYNCYKEINVVYHHPVSKYLFYISVILRLAYRLPQDTFHIRFSLLKEGLKNASSIRKKMKLLTIYILPQWILNLHYK